MEKTAIANTLMSYIEGYKNHNTELLHKVFHPSAKLMAIDNGKIDELATAEWFNKINEKRVNGAHLLEFHHEIIDIDYMGDTAIAKVQLIFAEFTFNDFLSLLKSADGWKIVNKIYTKTH